MQTYSQAGVDSQGGATALGALVGELNRLEGPTDGVGRNLLPTGYFASVLDIGGGSALALSTDGVGTKLLVSQMVGQYDTVGIDCVAMNVNDLLCVGAQPLAMLDYLAVGECEPEFFTALGRGLAEGARQARITIPGGECAQVPEMLHGVESGVAFDLVGTAVGIVSQDQINTGQHVRPGDAIIGLASSGLHSNGYSLARRVLLAGEPDLRETVPALGRSLAEELLEPTLIYVDFARALQQAGIHPHALVHITGDGLLNLLRVTSQVTFAIDNHPTPPPVFELIARRGPVEPAEMFRTFNMGLGMVAVVSSENADSTLAAAQEAGYQATQIGHVLEGPSQVRLPQWGLIGADGQFRS